MAYPVTLNGRTYTLADFEGQNYVDGLPDAFEDFVTHAGDIYNDTSTSSVEIGTGSKTFTVSSGKPYQAGTPLRIADAAAPSTNFLDAVVTSYSGTTLVVDAIGFGGSGTKTSWTINIGGAKTVDGTLGISQGGTGATTTSAARTQLGLGILDAVSFSSLDVTGSISADNIETTASGVTVTGDLKFGTSGKGIDFSATSDVSGMTSELLDDYEEGTFTPEFYGTTTNGVFVYSAQSGFYTKIGRAVHFIIHLVVSSTTTAPTGNLRISGLPFTVLNISGASAAMSYMANFGNTNHPNGAHCTPNATNILLRTRQSADSRDDILPAVACASLGGSPQISLSGVYFV